ncbi:outer membrane fimbrial usher protein [Proteus hauseri ATCC 700826]|uniref:Outer membrane fimbrial usher protein n=1 Tax=Proteus hauseri ATCC 700826 TaxID=1354271 RepID=A0AAJ3HSQ8_PROHU|nr:fimbria/pilus outer membrane usher protein [Proteus hauseri]OAT46553.1 outer membrane fimbrial usher protein [Proteus hauseri ATCC 700826]
MKSKIAKLNSITISFFSVFYCYNIYADNASSLYLYSLPNVDAKLIAQLVENQQLAGTYPTTLFVNNRKKFTKNIIFDNVDGKLTPKLSIEDLINLDINTDFYNIQSNSTEPLSLNEIGISFNDIFSTKSLYLTIPQKGITNNRINLPNKSLWDNGINALFSHYDYFGSYQKNRDIIHEINFNSGINLGSVRIRSNSKYIYNGHNNQIKIKTLYAYQQLDSLSSLIYGGKFTPTNRLLASENIMGVQLISNNLLSSHSLYANKPIIEGIAETYALVSVKQQDRIIYETSVPPGPFVLNALPTTGSSELTLEIKEADGRIKKSTHYFTMMPNQLNTNHYQYNLVAGYSQQSYYKKKDSQHPYFLGEFAYGINQKITSYAAFRKKTEHHTYLAGLIFSLGELGGLAADVSYLDNSHIKYRIRYNKIFTSTKTSLTLSSLYYKYNKPHENKLLKNAPEKKYTLSISQPFINVGHLSLSYYYFSYLTDKNSHTIDTTFSSYIKNINYSIKYKYNKKNNDNHFSFYFQLPLFNHRNTYHWINNQFSYNNNHYSNNTRFGGSFSPHSEFNYSIGYRNKFSPKNKSHNYSASMQYKGNYQSYRISGSHSSNNQFYHLNFGVSGAFLIHNGGVTLSPYLGKTFVLVDTQGFSGIKTDYSTKFKTDNFGYLILPNISPYKINKITLQSSTLPKYSEATHYTKSIVPTLGAISKITFPLKINKKVLFQSTSEIPFFATTTAFDSQNNMIAQSFVSDNNRIFFSGLSEVGWIKVKWGDEQHQQCQFNYDISNEMKVDTLIKKDIVCQ